ncbi:MAG: molybdenum cofactor guanylyltransferase [Anaerolineae bacterium]|nr:molybdenum cofactor guanylyltransferase [Anaerolineae bacterium]
MTTDSASPDDANAVTAVILAGGRSRRMGTDKSFVLLDGKPLIQHVIERVSALNTRLMLITNAPDKYTQFNIPSFRDIIPDLGALGGLYTALHHCPTPYAVCVACDMPFVNPTLLQHLVDLRDRYQAVAPRISGQIEGLHAVYSRSCLDVIQQQIDRNQLRLGDLFAHLNARYLDDAQVRTLDPELRSFVNLNTPDHLNQAQRRSNASPD